jgi:hypothetical protein
MQNYQKESLYLANREYQLRNEIERTGVYIGNDGYYIRAREEGFRRPIIAHILFGLPYGSSHCAQAMRILSLCVPLTSRRGSFEGVLIRNPDLGVAGE